METEPVAQAQKDRLVKRFLSTAIQLTLMAGLAAAGYFIWQDRENAANLAARYLGLEEVQQAKPKKKRISN